VLRAAWYYGAPGVLRRGVGEPLGELPFFLIRKEEAGLKKRKKKGNAIAAAPFIFRTTPRGFFGILTTHAHPGEHFQYLRERAF
jgi:hypothetical protein